MDDVWCTGVKPAVTPGSSATTPPLMFANTQFMAWKWAARTTSASGLSTAPASADHPASLTRWPPLTLPRPRGYKVQRKVNVMPEAAGRQRLLMRLSLSFHATVIKIEGRYDIVIRDDELEGTVSNTDKFLWSLHKQTNSLPLLKHQSFLLGVTWHRLFM